MPPSRQLQVHTESEERLWTELDYIVDYFQRLGHRECHLYFGWAWYKAPESHELAFKKVRTSLGEVASEVHKAENADLGRFTNDDVTLSFDELPLEFEFCHHSGIHLYFAEAGPITDHFFHRWRNEGLNPSLWENSGDPPSWKKVSCPNQCLANRDDTRSDQLRSTTDPDRSQPNDDKLS